MHQALNGTTSAPIDPKAPSGAEAIASRTKAIIETVTVEVTKQLGTARTAIEQLERLVIADCARVKAEIEANITLADTVAAEAQRIRDLVADLDRRRTSMMRADVTVN